MKSLLDTVLQGEGTNTGFAHSPCKEAAKTIEVRHTTRMNGHCSPPEGLLVPNASEEASLNQPPTPAMYEKDTQIEEDHSHYYD